VPGSGPLTVAPHDAVATSAWSKVKEGGPANPQDLNRYSYGLNNPIRNTDATGHCPIAEFGGSEAGACPGEGDTWYFAGRATGSGGLSSGGMAAAATTGAVAGTALAHLTTPDAGESVGGAGELAGATEPGAEPEQRRGPNPWGSRGSPAHRGTINERIRELENDGYEHLAGGDLPEEYIRIPDGGGRRPDLTMRAPDGSIYRENVGRTTAAGDPVARERRALNDIERATGARPGYTGYDRGPR
jgi:hypothetical protein